MKLIWILMLAAMPAMAASNFIPKHVDDRTGYISQETESVIDWANENYTEEQRAEVIRFCNEHAAKRAGAAWYKGNIPPGVVVQMQQEFQYCAVGMIKAWEAEE